MANVDSSKATDLNWPLLDSIPNQHYQPLNGTNSSLPKEFINVVASVKENLKNKKIEMLAKSSDFTDPETSNKYKNKIDREASKCWEAFDATIKSIKRGECPIGDIIDIGDKTLKDFSSSCNLFYGLSREYEQKKLNQQIYSKHIENSVFTSNISCSSFDYDKDADSECEMEFAPDDEHYEPAEIYQRPLPVNESSV
jgi:hypothetical protein